MACPFTMLPVTRMRAVARPGLTASMTMPSACEARSSSYIAAAACWARAASGGLSSTVMGFAAQPTIKPPGSAPDAARGEDHERVPSLPQRPATEVERRARPHGGSLAGDRPLLPAAARAAAEAAHRAGAGDDRAEAAGEPGQGARHPDRPSRRVGAPGDARRARGPRHRGAHAGGGPGAAAARPRPAAADDQRPDRQAPAGAEAVPGQGAGFRLAA